MNSMPIEIGSQLGSGSRNPNGASRMALNKSRLLVGSRLGGASQLGNNSKLVEGNSRLGSQMGGIAGLKRMNVQKFDRNSRMGAVSR